MEVKPSIREIIQLIFLKKVDVKNLTFLYEPAIEFIVNITKQGIKVDNPKTLKVGDKIDIENADHKPYGVSGSVTRKHENDIHITITIVR